MTYKVIIADPCWEFSDRLTMSATKRGAAANYTTMSTAEICRLPVPLVTASSAVLALWVPSAILGDGIRVMEAWGFTLKQTFVWVKTTKKGWGPAPARFKRLSRKPGLKRYTGSKTGLSFGLGRYFRQCHEIALIGTRGSIAVSSKSERSVSLDYNEGHSRKPDTLHQQLERLVPGGPYLELFARRKYGTWTCLGNEIDGKDIRSSLPDLMFSYCD